MNEIKEQAKEQGKGEVKAQPSAQQAEKVIYIGPPIKGVAYQGTVFDGGVPEGLEEKAKEMPAIRSLIVPVKDLPKANTALATPGSALDVLYKKVEAAQEKEG